MDAQQFLAEFGHIANAPGGVARLRELVYQFAVTGRLVPQQLNDGNTEDLLARIGNTRTRLIAEKRLKRSVKLESSPLRPPTIELPANWRWSRLLDLGEINPRNVADEEVPATFVPMAGVSERHGEAIQGENTTWC